MNLVFAKNKVENKTNFIFKEPQMMIKSDN